LQRQNDIRFMVLVDSALNHQHVYGYEYPAEPSVNLGKLFEALNIRVVMSNQAAFTILKNIAVGSFTQLDSASIKNETMSYAEYKAEIISSIKEFYQKKIAASGPSLEKMLAEQSVQALADITSKFNSVEQMVKKLFVDSGSGTLVYKISSDDESMDFYQSGIKSGYITYPSAGNGGGFVFNDKGIPTANVVDNSDMRIIQNNLGDLKATATAPVVVLQIPSMVDSYIFHK